MSSAKADELAERRFAACRAGELQEFVDILAARDSRPEPVTGGIAGLGATPDAPASDVDGTASACQPKGRQAVL